jgi:hypothetical protein
MKCEACGGSGRVRSRSNYTDWLDCPDCRGTGEKKKTMMRNEARTVCIDYTNWRGERSRRPIEPTGRMIWNDGSNQWHKTPGWLIEAKDLDDGIVKQFSMDTLHEWVSGNSHTGGKR